jgi:hypothetical protein
MKYSGKFQNSPDVLNLQCPLSSQLFSRSDRYWVRYGADNKVVALYKDTRLLFLRWSDGEWVDTSDRYLRITRDAACDEVSVDMAIIVDEKS